MRSYGDASSERQMSVGLRVYFLDCDCSSVHRFTCKVFLDVQVIFLEGIPRSHVKQSVLVKKGSSPDLQRQSGVPHLTE
jgi:hypothetical protein